MKNFKETPTHDKYDVIIIGGAIMGSSTAWFLSQNPDFPKEEVIFLDMSFEEASKFIVSAGTSNPKN